MDHLTNLFWAMGVFAIGYYGIILAGMYLMPLIYKLKNKI